MQLGRLSQYGINCLAQGQTKVPMPGTEPEPTDYWFDT